MNNNIKEKGKHVNPFFLPYGTPHETAPFDKITIDDYEEAIIEGIRRDNEQIEKMLNNPEEPTFYNTIVHEDEDEQRKHYYDLLDRVTSVFFNLLSAETNDEMDALAQKISPMLTKHSNDISLNPKIFERIKYVYDHHGTLTSEEQRVLENSYDGLVRSGALLNDKDKETLRKLTEKASMLSLQFSQNVLKENKAYSLHITDKNKLHGLPETALETALEAAKERNLDGWVFTLDMPSYSPFITYCKDRELRKEIYMARNTICTKDNKENNFDVCKQLVNVRREMAQLLGYKTYADYVMKYRMAAKVENVYKMLNDLIEAYKLRLLKKKLKLQRLQKKKKGNPLKCSHGTLLTILISYS